MLEKLGDTEDIWRERERDVGRGIYNIEENVANRRRLHAMYFNFAFF